MEKIARDLSQAQKRNSYLFSSRCIDLNALYINAIAGAEPEHAKIPLTLGNDRDAIQAAIGSIGLIPAEQLKIIRIKNTANLGVVDVFNAYRSELSKRPDLELIDESRPLAFDVNWNLTPF